MGEDPEDHIAVLQSRVRERLDELRPLRPGTDAYGPAADAVLEATRELIDYEERLPVLLDRAPRRRSLLIVRWSGVVTGAIGTSLGIAAVAGWSSRWWLLLVIPVIAAAVTLLLVPVQQPRGAHQVLRPGALAVAAGALVTLVGVLVRLPFWAVGLGMALLLGGLWHVRRVSIRIDAV
jgi:hypothetical protein